MRRTFSVLLLLALCATLVACGGGSKASEAGGDNSVGTTDSSKAQPINTGKVATIVMQNISFVAPLTIVKLGTKITWVNKDSVQHDVKSTDGEKIDSPLFGKDHTFTFTPTKVGAIDYVCSVHPGMKGRIQIEK